MTHHLLLGGGPGQLLGTIGPYITPSFARHLGPRLVADSHDFLVEVAVTTGLAGLVIFLTWLIAALRCSWGPWAGFGIMILAVELIDPMNIGVTPLAFLALGVSAGGGGAPPWWISSHPTRARPEGDQLLPPASLAQDEVQERKWSGWWTIRRRRFVAVGVTCVTIVMALVLGGTMLYGDLQYSRARQNFQLPTAKVANQLIPYWPESARWIGFLWQYASVVRHDRDLLRNAAESYLVAALREPAVATDWVNLAEVQLTLGERQLAIGHLQRALQDDPWDACALVSLGQLAAGGGAVAGQSESHWLDLARLATGWPISKLSKPQTRILVCPLP